MKPHPHCLSVMEQILWTDHKFNHTEEKTSPTAIDVFAPLPFSPAPPWPQPALGNVVALPLAKHSPSPNLPNIDFFLAFLTPEVLFSLHDARR